MSSVSLSLVLFLLLLRNVFAGTLICEVIYKSQYDNENLFLPFQTKTFLCNSWFHSCCEEGCCFLFSQMPWFIIVLMGSSILITLVVVFCYLFVLLRLKKKRRRAILTGIVQITSSRRENDESPPDYSAAVRDNNILPSYETAAGLHLLDSTSMDEKDDAQFHR